MRGALLAEHHPHNVACALLPTVLGEAAVCGYLSPAWLMVQMFVSNFMAPRTQHID
jgi:hypothetical protein